MTAVRSVSQRSVDSSGDSSQVSHAFPGSCSAPLIPAITVTSTTFLLYRCFCDYTCSYNSQVCHIRPTHTYFSRHCIQNRCVTMAEPEDVRLLPDTQQFSVYLWFTTSERHQLPHDVPWPAASTRSSGVPTGSQGPCCRYRRTGSQAWPCWGGLGWKGGSSCV